MRLSIIIMTITIIGYRVVSAPSVIKEVFTILLYHHNLRELFYNRNPGDVRVKVGSDREAATSPDAAKPRCGQDPWFQIAVMRGGTLQNWPC